MSRKKKRAKQEADEFMGVAEATAAPVEGETIFVPEPTASSTNSYLPDILSRLEATYRISRDRAVNKKLESIIADLKAIL